MKLHEIKPIPVVRIEMKQQGNKAEYLTVVDTTRDECIDTIKQLVIQQGLSLFEEGTRLSVTVRTGLGQVNNSDSKSFNFRGLTPQQLMEIILNYLKENEKTT